MKVTFIILILSTALISRSAFPQIYDQSNVYQQMRQQEAQMREIQEQQEQQKQTQIMQQQLQLQQEQMQQQQWDREQRNNPNSGLLNPYAR